MLAVEELAADLWRHELKLGRNLKEAGFLLEEELSHDYGKKRNRGMQDDSWSHGWGIKCLIDAAVENLQQFFCKTKCFQHAIMSHMELEN